MFQFLYLLERHQGLRASKSSTTMESNAAWIRWQLHLRRKTGKKFNQNYIKYILNTITDIMSNRWY